MLKITHKHSHDHKDDISDREVVLRIAEALIPATSELEGFDEWVEAVFTQMKRQENAKRNR